MRRYLFTSTRLLVVFVYILGFLVEGITGEIADKSLLCEETIKSPTLLDKLFSARESDFSDLTVTKTLFKPGKIEPGDNLKLIAAVKNLNLKTSIPTGVDFYFSKNKKFNKSDIHAGYKELPQIKQGKKRTVRFKTQMLNTIKPGKYYLIAYVDRDNLNLDPNPKNNICASQKKITVKPERVKGVIAYCYQLVQGGLYQIYTINADGSGNKKIIDASIGLNHHDISPDGQKFVCVGYFNQSTWSIYVFNIDGTGLTRLTTAYNILDSEPAWSPDGTQIVFTRIYPDQNYKNEIWIMNADGSNLQYTGIEGFGARWAPDGTKIIFTNIGDWGPPGLKGSDIIISNIDGTNRQQITNTSGDEWYPSWSPDGAKIVFHYSNDGNYESNEIFLMNSDGTARQQLTNNTSWDGMPRWSTDSPLICYSSDLSAYQHWEVYIMNPDGTNIRRVTNTSSDATAINPVWLPNKTNQKKKTP